MTDVGSEHATPNGINARDRDARIKAGAADVIAGGPNELGLTRQRVCQDPHWLQQCSRLGLKQNVQELRLSAWRYLQQEAGSAAGGGLRACALVTYRKSDSR